jgi:hypothetical protein
MHFRKSLAAVAAFAVLAGCEQSPTSPATETTAFSVQNALSGGGLSFQDDGPKPGIMGRLVHAALGKIRHDSGDDAARAAATQLRTLVTAVRTARQAHDTAAVRAAATALRTAEATLIVSTLGTEPVTRSLDMATRRVAGMNEMVTRGTAAGRDVTRLKDLAADMTQKLAAAKAAAAAGNNTAALLGALEILEVSHQLNVHHRDRP